MEREQRKRQILSRVGEYGPCLTERQIGKLVGMTKSPHLTSLLEEMTTPQSEGEKPMLIVQWARHSNRTMCRFFSTPEQAPCLM